MPAGFATPLNRTAAALAVLVATLLAVGALAGPAHASFGIAAFDGAVSDSAGNAFTQAGGHPDAVSTIIDFNTFNGPAGTSPDGNIRNLTVNLPQGFVGNPTAVPRCTTQEFSSGSAGILDPPGCPPGSQVGIAELSLAGQGDQTVSVYNMVPPHGAPAQFGFKVVTASIFITGRVRSGGDYGISVDVADLSQGIPVFHTKLTLWGEPADPSHDADRGKYCVFGFCVNPGGAPAGVGIVPFLTNPTTCSGPQEVTLHAESWAAVTESSDASFVTHDPPGAPLPSSQWGGPQGTTGCDAVPFDPALSVQPTTTQPDAPTGLDVHLAIPTDGLLNPNGIAQSNLKRVAVTLPDGMTINPAAATGLTACSDDRLGLGTTNALGCPESSKIGTVTASSPLLDVPLSGGVYVRTQSSADPASGEMFRIALVLANAERGLDVRLPGSIRADPLTGRIVATFDNSPDLPVSDLTLSLKSGPRAPLATPPTCGPKTIDAELTSWSGKTVSRQSKSTIDCPAGLGGFAPSFTAGAVSPVAGASSPFALGISKADGNAAIDGLSMVLPAGLVAQLKGNLGAQVGSVKAFAGPGSNPFMLPGQVFLEGPYGDAPFSLRVVVPAKAGPFDLGTVTVRQKIYVDPIDAHVTVVSDPLPTIVSGVPVRLQRLDVSVDKPGFMINRTSCEPTAISGTLSAAGGQTVAVSSRFQVGACANLGLDPGLAIGLTGKGQTVDGKHPGVSAVLKQSFGGQSNLKRVRVTLPLSLALDPDNAQALCEFVDGSKVEPTCPAASIVGHATAVTPILEQPLSGPVYFVKNVRTDAKTGRPIKTLPKLVIPLKGNGVALTLTATSAVEDDHLVTTFDAIPDAPVSDFTLNIDGGSHGILAVSGEKVDICKATQIVTREIDGQNNASADGRVVMSTPCPLGVVASSHTVARLRVTVGGIGAGKVSVSGKGLAKTSRTIGSATTATLTPRLSKSAQRTLAHHRNVKVRVTVSYTPKGTKKAKTTHKTLTIHSATQ